MTPSPDLILTPSIDGQDARESAVHLVMPVLEQPRAVAAERAAGEAGARK